MMTTEELLEKGRAELDVFAPSEDTDPEGLIGALGIEDPEVFIQTMEHRFALLYRMTGPGYAMLAILGAALVCGRILADADRAPDYVDES